MIGIQDEGAANAIVSVVVQGEVGEGIWGGRGCEEYRGVADGSN